MFELSVCIRDSKGIDTGRKKTFTTDSAYKLAEYWNNHISTFVVSKKNDNHKKKKVAAILPSDDEAQSILKLMFKD